MFPAREGDCLIVTYGEPGALKRILIDGGRKATYADLKPHLEGLPAAERNFELLIVSHVDRDHIEGILELLDDSALPVTFKDIWFNGYHHLHMGEFETFSAVQGERLTEQLKKRVAAGESRWNGKFAGKAAALPADNSPVVIALDDHMTLTLLGPSREKMTALIPKWEAECRDAGMVINVEAQDPDPEGFETFAAIDIDALADEPFEEDTSKPNGSSIAILAQYNGKSALLSGDSHTDLLAESLGKLAGDGGKPVLHAFKVPHHGSRKNISTELLQSFQCKNYLVSTSGSYFDHPDQVAMSRLIKYGGPDKHIWFNYSSVETQIWQVPSWMEDYDYAVHYPDAASDGYQVLDLE